MLFIFSTPVLIRHLWQPKTVVFLHLCLVCAVLLPKSQPGRFVVKLFDLSALTFMQETDALTAFLEELLRLLVHLLLEERLANAHALLELHALPAALLLAGQLGLALVSGQDVELVLGANVIKLFFSSSVTHSKAK